MRRVPARSSAVRLLTVIAAFVGGPLLGLGLAARFTPGSDLVRGIGPLAFLSVFLMGALLWMGTGVVTVVARVLLDLLRGRGGRRAVRDADSTLVPAGHRAFVVLGVTAGVLVGCVAGLLTPLGLWAAVALWGLAGLGYGWALHRAANHGWLPFPEPD